MTQTPYAPIIREMLREKQKQAPAWYQLRCVALALAKVAETMGGEAARDLGSGPVSLSVPCPACNKMIEIRRKVNDFGAIRETCRCGHSLFIP
jgi:hypothetical protein